MKGQKPARTGKNWQEPEKKTGKNQQEEETERNGKKQKNWKKNKRKPE